MSKGAAVSATGGSEPSSTSERSDGAPLGIKILCVVSGLFSTLFLLLGIVAFGDGEGTVALVSLVLMGVSATSLVALYGLWTLQAWGWILYLALYGISSLINLVQGDFIALIVNVLLIAYVFSKKDLYLYRAN